VAQRVDHLLLQELDGEFEILGGQALEFQGQLFDELGADHVVYGSR